MKRKVRTYRITSMILMIMCTALLIKSNSHNSEKADIIDKYFDLQEEYDKIFQNVQELEQYSEKLEEQVDLLTSFIADPEYEVDTVTSGKEVVR